MLLVDEYSYSIDIRTFNNDNKNCFNIMFSKTGFSVLDTGSLIIYFYFQLCGNFKMEKSRTTEVLNILHEQKSSGKLLQSNFTDRITKNKSVFEKFSSEGFENLYHYVDWLGLANDPDLVILPSANHLTDSSPQYQ